MSKRTASESPRERRVSRRDDRGRSALLEPGDSGRDDLTMSMTAGETGFHSGVMTGLDYFLARYYSGAQGRFTSPDKPFADQYFEDPQSWNLYTYVRNNPLRLMTILAKGRKRNFREHGRAQRTRSTGPCLASPPK